MPTTSPGGRFTVPVAADPPDVPYWLNQLATQLEGDRTGLGAAGGRLHIQTLAAATTDAIGLINYTHAAGFTPVAVFLLTAAPGTYFALPWGTDTYTGTTFRARFAAVSTTGPLVSSNVGPQIALIFG